MDSVVVVASETEVKHEQEKVKPEFLDEIYEVEKKRLRRVLVMMKRKCRLNEVLVKLHKYSVSKNETAARKGWRRTHNPSSHHVSHPAASYSS